MDHLLWSSTSHQVSNRCNVSRTRSGKVSTGDSEMMCKAVRLGCRRVAARRHKVTWKVMGKVNGMIMGMCWRHQDTRESIRSWR
jgi:hypothetical protein